jgi:hypothetical protein
MKARKENMSDVKGVFMVLTNAYRSLLYMFHCWIRVSKWLLPHNAKLFVLVTLKAAGILYVELCKRWWPLLMFISGVLVLHKLAILWVIALFLLIYIYYAISRPSIDQKTITYVLAYKKHFFWFCLFIIIAMSLDELSYLCLLGSWYNSFYYIPLAVLYGLIAVIRLPLLCVTPLVTFSGLTESKPLFLLLFLYPFPSFFILFLLDSRATATAVLKSLYRASVMQWFTLPFTVPATCLMFGCYYMLHFYFFPYSLAIFSGVCSEQILSQGVALLSIFALPVFISFWTNVYIKHVHDEFSLYCRQQC